MEVKDISKYIDTATRNRLMVTKHLREMKKYLGHLEFDLGACGRIEMYRPELSLTSEYAPEYKDRIIQVKKILKEYKVILKEMEEGRKRDEKEAKSDGN